MSHISLAYHIVFGTYRRKQVITPEHERELYKFIYTLSVAQGAMIRRIGGMPDHVHILCDLPSKLSVAEYVKLIKTESSKFMKVNEHFPTWDKWAQGYAAFTVDASLREVRKNYIANQKEHHATLDFENEYINMLKESGLELPEFLKFE